MPTMEQIMRRKRPGAYTEWDPFKAMPKADAEVVKQMSLKARYSKKEDADDDSDFDPNDMSYEEYLKRKKRERQSEREDWFDNKVKEVARTKYELRPGQLDPQTLDNIGREIKDGLRAQYNRKAFFMEKSRIAENRGVASKTIDTKDVLEERLATAIHEAGILEAMRDKTYNYHNKAIYDRKLEQKMQQINKIRSQLQNLEFKKLPGQFSPTMNL